MNTHCTEVSRHSVSADFIPSDAPDPRVSVLGYDADIPPIADAALKDTAAVICAILMKDDECWHAGLAFEHFYVSEEWIRHLFSTLRTVDLMEFAALLRERAQPDGHLVLGVKPQEIALAVEVWKAGERELHLICQGGHEPPRWRSLLDGVSALRSQARFCSTLTYLNALHGDLDATDWVAEHFSLQLKEAG